MSVKDYREYTLLKNFREEMKKHTKIVDCMNPSCSSQKAKLTTYPDRQIFSCPDCGYAWLKQGE